LWTTFSLLSPFHKLCKCKGLTMWKHVTSKSTSGCNNNISFFSHLCEILTTSNIYDIFTT
jgi:hypothetical protein